MIFTNEAIAMTNPVRFDHIRLRTLCIALLSAYPIIAEADVAGRFQFVAGDVRIIANDGKERIAKKGLEVNEGETVLTAPKASAQLKMIDGGLVALRPDTQLKMITYTFHGKEDGSEKAVFSLLKGGLRAISGLIGKTNKENYAIQTPSATIGIRGTDHEPMVVLPPPPGVVATNPPGTYDKVNVGVTSLTTQVGTTFIANNQVGFAPSPTQPPVLLPTMPDFYQASNSPRATQNQKQEQETASDISGEKSRDKPSASDHAASEKPDAGQSGQAATSSPAALIPTSFVAPPITTPTTAVLIGKDESGNTLNITTQTTPTAGPTAAPTVDPVPNRSYTPGTTLLLSDPYKMDPYSGSGSALTRDVSGNLTGATIIDMHSPYSGFSGYGKNTFSQTGSSLPDLGQDAGTGLAWGRWQGGQLTQSSQYFGQDSAGNWGVGASDSMGAFIIGATQSNTVNLGTASLHWISGKEAFPDHLSHIITGTANYTLLGGTQPSDMLGNTGTLNGASLAVNFTTQRVDASVKFTIANNTWGMLASQVPLDNSASFWSYSCGVTACGNKLSLSKNGVALDPATSSTYGSLNGKLMGAALNSAGLQYSVTEWVPITYPTGPTYPTMPTYPTGSNNLIQGVAGFSGPIQDVATPYRAVGLEDGSKSGGSHYYGLPGPTSSPAVSTAPDEFRGSVDSNAAPLGRVVDSAAGLTEFLGSAHGYMPLTTSVSPASNYQDNATIKIGTAVNRDVGSANIAGTTVSWGRWEGGNIDIFSQDGTVKIGTIDNTSRNIHWLATSALSGNMTTLPLTGTASYTVVGNTNPTDFNGNIGKLGAVTLNADFTNMKVNAAINVSFNSAANTSNLSMTASNIPLEMRGGFNSSTALNGVNGIVHTASCSGASCGTQTQGYIKGGLFGSGAPGAMMTYGMTTGTVAGTTTSVPINAIGLVMMKR